MLKCFGCNAEKDMAVEEIYPYPEDERFDPEPMPPLFVLEVQPSDPRGDKTWKVAVICHHCFHKLDPDMWISENCWKSINAVNPFDKLPENDIVVDHTKEFPYTEKWEPATYRLKD